MIFLPILLSFLSIKASKIAIIGCGAGGASASHYLSNYDVTIFESTDQCGGRADFVKVQHLGKIELGASFFIENNLYFKELVNLTGNEIKKRASPDEDGSLGIFDENYEVTLNLGNWDIVNMGKMVYYFGLAPRTLQSLASQSLEKFSDIYKYLDEGKSFQNLQTFEKVINMEKKSQETLTKHLKLNGVSEELTDDFVSAIITGIYNQNYQNFNALAGTVALIGSLEEAYSLVHGNRKLFIDLVKQNFKKFLLLSLNKNLKVKYNSSVIQVRKYNNLFNLSYINHDEILTDSFDIVIIATLNSNQQIKFDDKIQNYFRNLQNSQKTQDTFIYIINGVINYHYFKFQSINDLPRVLISKKIEKTIISEVFSICHTCLNGMGVYKFQSTKQLSSDEISMIFQDYTIIKEKFWTPAYPRLTPLKEYPKLILDESLYHLNSMEYLASCMEMEIIAAKNIANLINEFINQKRISEEL